jgi:predicted ATPase
VLGALPADQTVSVAAARLGLAPAELPEQVAQLVRERAGGNPFFAEELVAALRDEGLIQIEADTHMLERQRCIVSDGLQHAGLALPNTIQGVILARIDRLPPEERLTLSIAAVIGSTFAYALLYSLRAQQAMIEQEALKQQLRSLAARDFIWLETPAPQLAYRFKHVLTQEAAYQSLLSTQRRDIHRQVAGWYEQTFGNQQPSAAGRRSPEIAIGLSPYLSILAHHCRQAEDAERERHYLALLGEQAISIGAFDHAIRCFERALTLTPPAAQAQHGRILGRLARAYLLLGQNAAAERFYQESGALAEAAADQLGAAAAAYELGSLAYRRANLDQSLAYLARSLNLYRAAADQAGEARALNQLGAIYIELDDQAKALECYQQALALGRKGRAN